MSSHYCVTDHRKKGAVRLRELDDSRRGARFCNRKEDKLLERKLIYLNNQNKRIQVSINREKEFIKTINSKDNDRDMNHLDRRYRGAMGFILEYKLGRGLDNMALSPPPSIIRSNSSLKPSTANSIPKKPNSVKFNRPISMNCDRSDKKPASSSRIKSAPMGPMRSSTPRVRQAWLGNKISKLSVETESSSSSLSSDDQSACDTYRPFTGRHVTESRSPSVKPHNKTESKRDHLESSVSDQALKNKRSALRRLNTSKKNDFWSLLRQKPQSPGCSEFSQNTKRPSLVRATKLIMQEEKVVKLFMKVDKLKQNGATPPCTSPQNNIFQPSFPSNLPNI